MKQKRDRLNDESRLSRFTTHVVLIFASFLAFGPFVWMFLTSIKTYEETIQIPMKFLPEIPQWVNFSIVSDKLNFPQLYLNTILVTIMMIVGQILIVTICAYAFDRLNFPGKNVLFMGMLALMMVPGQIFIIPRFKLMVNLGLTNTLVGLVLPGLFNIFGVFLMRQFFSTLPRELDEAARIDGMLDMVLAEMRATKAAGEGNVPIVITGDDAEALAALVGHSLTVDDALTLRGLAELYRINQKPRRV